MKAEGVEDRRIDLALRRAAALGALRGGAVPVSCGAADRDDCAVLEIGGEFDLVIGSDFVRGTEFFLFREGILSYQDIGWYLAAANISDVAAMGARQAGLLVAVRWSKALTDAEWEAIHEGIAGACSAFGAPLLGGDSGGFSETVLSGCAIGLVPRGRALLRSGGRPGDRLFLTGTVGTAGAAIAYFTRGRHEGVRLDPPLEAMLATAWRRVTPAVDQGVWLAESGMCQCAIDTSDGLRAGLYEIARRSNVDVIVDGSRIPIDHATRAVGEAMGLGALDLAMSDSVDFRLLFSAAPGNADAVGSYFEERGWALHEIGYMRDSANEPRVLQSDSHGAEVPGIPWDQSDVPVIDRLRSRG